MQSADNSGLTMPRTQNLFRAQIFMGQDRRSVFISKFQTIEKIYLFNVNFK